MRIDLNFEEGVTFLAVTGDVDVATADELRTVGENALTKACSTLRIDLGGVTFLDSSGIGALVHIRNSATHCRLILDNPPPQVRKILDLTGLTDIFDIEPAVLPVAAKSA
jgi:anti-anti-sigma factor